MISNCKNNPFPGLGYSIPIFAVVYAIDMMVGEDDHGHGHGDHGHEEASVWEKEVGEKPAYTGPTAEAAEEH